ncbi:aromatic-ring hydroxylase C-terminal domain-containing protein [Gluconobacter oxydans]|uniref:FAD-binding domain-containing protein n=1 Tax=Gluconobacter oxydans TaxID=442 RepID=A0AB35ARM1_GLUOY|nr:FAD-dependent monooxygenase [Gluconobacter oxydans]MBF0857417.1 hypothetical protein [Gluconobacter oxydans]
MNLGWKLALTIRDDADPGLMDSYQRDRWPVADLLDRSRSDSLRKLADCYQDQLSYIGCNTKECLGLYALLIRLDGFIAWASDNSSDGSEAIHALSKWLVVSPKQ